MSEIKAQVGAVLEAGQAVLGIETGGESLDVLIYVAPADGKRVKAGMQAQVSPVTVRPVEFGSLTGVVESISEFPVSLDGMTALLQNEDLAMTFTRQWAALRRSRGPSARPDDRQRLRLDVAKGRGCEHHGRYAGRGRNRNRKAAACRPCRAVVQGKIRAVKSSTELRPNLRPRLGGRRAVPTVLQMETTESAAACLAMILAYHGKWAPLDECASAAGIARRRQRGEPAAHGA